MLAMARPAKAKPFNQTAIDALGSLRPHVLRAEQVRQRLNGAKALVRDAMAALDHIAQAVMLVDSGAAVMHANRTAEVALGSGDGLRSNRAGLVCEHVDDTAKLRRLIGQAPATALGGMLAVRRSSGRRPLSVLVAPLRGEPALPWGPRATATVIIADPEAAISARGAQLRTLYGLTAAEVRTAEALLEHKPLADVAAKLGVTLATVRTLLQRAFDKTETHSQAELVRLMLAHRLPRQTTSQPE
jgi:DNA-binding CsgD family transcriptional regulator